MKHLMFLLPFINALVTVVDSDSYDMQDTFDIEDDNNYNLSNTDSNAPSTSEYNPLQSRLPSDDTYPINDTYPTNDTYPINLKVPKRAFRSIRYGKIKTNPENLETLIQHEMEDISPDLHNKIRKKLAKSNVDRSRYKDLFFIKKRIIQDGNRKIVSFDIKEKIIPKNGLNDPINRDLSLRVILAGILFLLAGLVFTTTMKMYQNVFKNNLFPYDGKKEQNKESL